MSQKLKKIKCNLTGKIIQIYKDYYDKKVAQYGGEELLEKFYIQNKNSAGICWEHEALCQGIVLERNIIMP